MACSTQNRSFKQIQRKLATSPYPLFPQSRDGEGRIAGSPSRQRRGSANEFYARIGSSTSGAAPGTFRLAVANESWNVANTVEYGLDLQLNTTYQVVFRLDLATDQTTLWVNPTDESSPSVTATDAISYSGTINAYALRQGTSGTGAPGDLFVDNLLVGQSFADVTAVPEPSTYALIGTGLAAFCFMRLEFGFHQPDCGAVIDGRRQHCGAAIAKELLIVGTDPSDVSSP